MYLTADFLQRHKACGEGFNKFIELFPDGCEVLDILQDERVPSHMLHWGYQHLANLNEEEKKAYEKRMSIENCVDFFESRNIKNCQHIFSSQGCKNSSLVKQSFKVENSNLVSDSKRIYNSNAVFESYEVYDCDTIVNSKRVHNSKNIAEAKEIHHSKYVYDSDFVFRSEGIVGCSRIEDSFFSVDCENSINLMFCAGLRAMENCLFNRPLKKEEFFRIKRECAERFPELEFNFFKVDNNLPTGTKTGYTINFNLKTRHNSIPSEFYDYIKTLPSYDPFVMYRITLNPKFLEEMKI